MTPGQKLYELLHPKYITVYAARTPWAEAMVVENPELVVPWHLLTERCRQSYEQQAVGHYLLSQAPA